MKNNMYKYIDKFFNSYLVNEINASNTTIANYKDTFKVLFKYINSECNFKLKDFSFEHFTKDFVLSFLNWLEEKRNNSISTRNTRYETLSSFSNYVLQFEINNVNLIQILRIPRKKQPEKKVEIMEKEHVLLLLKQPDTKTKRGRRDLAIMTLLYDSGLRIFELLNLKVMDVNLDGIKNVQVWFGKGNKNRKVPISDETADILRIYIKDYNKHPSDLLFTNSKNQKLCSNAIRKKLNNYCKKAKEVDSSFINHIYPHLFRHTKATHLINDGVSCLEVKEFLGHANLESTQIYITTDISKKRDALKTIEQNILDHEQIVSNYSDEEYFDWLSKLTN